MAHILGSVVLLFRCLVFFFSLLLLLLSVVLVCIVSCVEVWFCLFQGKSMKKISCIESHKQKNNWKKQRKMERGLGETTPTQGSRKIMFMCSLLFMFCCCLMVVFVHVCVFVFESVAVVFENVYFVMVVVLFCASKSAE